MKPAMSIWQQAEILFQTFPSL